MCGIGGVLSSGRGVEIEPALQHMQRALRHRGPDDQGMVLFKLGKESAERATASGGFVHARLSILDLSPAGHQPMGIPDRRAKSKNRYWITFNGEIYNFNALRAELEGEGVTFRSRTDTEVILRLYERDGPRCVERLRGMFALAIWDDDEQVCFLARDPLGIKPLYYSHTPDRLVFASELRSVLASRLVARELDAGSVLGFFQTGSVPEPGTMIRGIKMLDAGTWLTWKQGAVARKKYWRIHFGSTSEVRECAGETVRDALFDSIQHHFVSDVPVGVFLSGGIDSTAIVALARKIGQHDLRTFSISLADPKLDEGDLAGRTAHDFRTSHTDLRLDGEVARDLFQAFLGHLDQPTIDGFNTFTVSKLAHDHGMKVVLSGLGGDEIFGGYPTFRRVPQMVRWGKLARFIPPFRECASYVLAQSRRPQFRRLGSFLGGIPSTEAAYRAYRGIYALDEAQEIVKELTGQAVDGLKNESVSALTLADEVSSLEIEHYMRNQLLRDSDVMSMAWGLELRVPFVDRALFDSVASIPAAVRLRPGKRILLEAVPEIPPWVWQQPKRGFSFPFEEWLTNDWRGLFQGNSLKSGVRAQTWYQKWSLFVLQHWCERNNVSCRTES